MKSQLFFVLLPLFLLLPSSAIRFDIQNNCSYTLWPAVLPYGGGRHLDSGQTWTLDFADGPRLARIWARTNCSFDSSGRGSCLTGDCAGQLNCTSYGTPPLSKAEYGLNNFAHMDYYDISLIDGFNVPLEMTPTTNGCSKSIRCSADVVGQCPADLRAPGGCQNPCTVYKTPEYCCRAGRCLPTDKSRFFKALCAEAFTYPEDDPTSTFTCPEGTNYRVVFCP
ncbi:protein P21-like [Salvia splendens]|uniref:protein P21-like n=1 Tax=Salvia splendens TaxID=180675 RepID=UPI001C25B49E|nr:protein P21-like [Salvia splendens]